MILRLQARTLCGGVGRCNELMESTSEGGRE
jgi:hypothetical protein